MLVEKTEKMIKEMEELKVKIITKLVADGDIQNIPTDLFEMLQCCAKTIDTSLDIAREQATLLESMDKKLDKLLAK